MVITIESKVMVSFMQRGPGAYMNSYNQSFHEGPIQFHRSLTFTRISQA